MATVQIRIGPADNGRRMTLEEFREAEEEPGYRYELARGFLEATEVPDDSHGQIVSNLGGAFHRYNFKHPRVIRRIGGGGEFRLWVPEMVSGRNPDVAIVFRDAPKDHRGRRRPALVVEVVSEGGEDRDYRAKREEYWTFGVQEYWIVDRSLRTVLTLIRQAIPGSNAFLTTMMLLPAIYFLASPVRLWNSGLMWTKRIEGRKTNLEKIVLSSEFSLESTSELVTLDKNRLRRRVDGWESDHFRRRSIEVIAWLLESTRSGQGGCRWCS